MPNVTKAITDDVIISAFRLLPLAIRRRTKIAICSLKNISIAKFIKSNQYHLILKMKYSGITGNINPLIKDIVAYNRFCDLDNTFTVIKQNADIVKKNILQNIFFFLLFYNSNFIYLELS
jgi:hypothetical protein